MKPTKILFLALALLLTCSAAQAQFGKRLGKAVENAAKRTVERKAEQKTEKAVSKAIDKATDPDTYKNKDKDKDGNDGKNDGRDDAKASGTDEEESSDVAESDDDKPEDAKAAEAESADDKPKDAKAAEIVYAKSDFVPGDEIIFSDDLANEQMGEFPSQWDVLSGSAEVISINGVKGFEVLNEGTVVPLMKEQKNYLPDVFTLEYDFFYRNGIVAKRDLEGTSWRYGHYYLTFFDAAGKECFEIKMRPSSILYTSVVDAPVAKARTFDYDWHTGAERRTGKTQPMSIQTETWHHISVSFNKRALKFYFDGTRLFNIPNMNKPAYFTLKTYTSAVKLYFFSNVRIAQGAVPLYDRMMTDGKIITYGITFDVGKSTIKPESMGEINRIAKLMTDNPDLKFSVEGHTDSTGSELTNQKLSDERSAVIIAKLVEMGITVNRLQGAGKGQTSPIADNSTDEGRAKNRRVEFVKIN
jgi:outer membrane protein OmpA-like peptidoglycan-associated protein